MEIDGAITILVDPDVTRIRIHDRNSSIEFVEIELTSSQFVTALSRLVHTPCKMKVHRLDLVGKKMENKEFIFELPNDEITWRYNNKDEIIKIAQDLLDKEGEGWLCNDMFNSWCNFFTRDGKPVASCVIRRWI